jgi:DNA-binding protein H-NS
MRKPRDYDSELKALDDKAKLLRNARLTQLGTLVISTGADALPIEELAGVLLSAVETKDAAPREGWRDRGAAFFQGQQRQSSTKADHVASRSAASDSSASPPDGVAKPQ